MSGAIMNKVLDLFGVDTAGEEYEEEEEMEIFDGQLTPTPNPENPDGTPSNPDGETGGDNGTGGDDDSGDMDAGYDEGTGDIYYYE